jgi:zinc protease
MIINRNIAPSINEIKSFNIVEAGTHILPNGIPIYKLNSDNSEIVKIEWLFSAGNWYQNSPLVAFAVNSMLIEGSEKFTSSQIAEMIEFFGGQIGYNVDKDNAFVSLTCTCKHLCSILEIFGDVIKNATFPDQELEIFKNKHKQQFLVEQSKVRNIARSVHSRMLFGNHHPYGYIVIDNDFDNLNRKDLLQFYRQRYQSRYCKIIVSGNASDDVIKAIENHFGTDHWNETAEIFNPSFDLLTEGERISHVNKPDAVQSAVRIGKVLFNKLHPDFTGMSVLNCVLGGYFGSRLMRKIREEKGYTYGINSILVEYKNSGYLAIVSELGSDVTTPAINDIYNEINKLSKETISNEELTRVKNYMLGDMVRMFDGPFAQAESLISLLECGLGYDYYLNMIELVRNITPKELQHLAQTYLNPESLCQVVVGKEC